MNYLRLAIAILFAVCVQCSYADSIETFWVTQATMVMFPDTSGDNLSFSFTGPGVSISGLGGMACFFWCVGPISDTSIAQPSEVFLSGFDSPAIIGGIKYDGTNLGLESPLFDQSGFNAGGLNASATFLAIGVNTVVEFKLRLPTNGGWGFNFAPTVDENGNPAFIFTDGEFSATQVTPEPGMVGLMLTGLAGIAGMAKTRDFRRLHRK
jgi:hypothetical protein